MVFDSTLFTLDVSPAFACVVVFAAAVSLSYRAHRLFIMPDRIERARADTD